MSRVFVAASVLVGALALGLSGCQSPSVTTSIPTDKRGETLATWLSKPDGNGPFPAVVLMHGCGGTERNTPHQAAWRGLNRHAALLNKNGYVTLIVDSFGPRNINDGCQTGGKYYPVQVADAHIAFDHLASQPYVDDERIGFIGLSLGGGTALSLASRSSVDNRTESGSSTFAALVAYYPWCDSNQWASLDLPVLILIGAEDDWTPAVRCINLHSLVENAPNRRNLLELKVYPNAHHSFDLPMGGPYYVKGMDGRLHTVQGNDGARQDSQERMLSFFDKYLASSNR